jgi:hypothetical protein
MARAERGKSQASGSKSQARAAETDEAGSELREANYGLRVVYVRTLPDRRDSARVGDGLVAGEHDRVFAGGALAIQRSGADHGVVDVEVQRQQVHDFLVHWIDGAPLVRADDGLDGAE